MRNRSFASAAAILAFAMVSTVAYAQSEGPTKEVSTFKDWKTFEHRGAPGDICFATSQPKETEPTGVSRESAYFYVSAWPSDGVKSEVSLKLGYAIKSDSTVTVEIGNARFSLFSKGDKAFVSDPNEELKLVNAMKRGSFMTVTATSDSGTQTKDTYSLLGVTAAINAINSCT
ncbi:MAG: invasion associated locus B family protein [Pseudomonadota bacterium]